MGARSRAALMSRLALAGNFETARAPSPRPTQPTWPIGDDLVQANWPGLECALEDDDAWAWGDIGSVFDCIVGDSYTCLEYEDDQPRVLLDVCRSACNATDERLYAQYVHDGGNWSRMIDHLVGHSWFVVCMWQAVMHLPRFCNGTFTAMLPSAPSNNLAPVAQTLEGPELVLHENGTDVTVDACNAHALCYVCADADGKLNKYCEAVLQRYAWYTVPADWGGSELEYVYNAKELVWEDGDMEDFWCTAEVLSAIDDGSFKTKLEAGDWSAEAR